MYKYIIILLILVACTKKTKKTVQKENSDKGLATFIEYPKATDISLRFLDEYIYPYNIKFKNTIIGGLSGICFNKGTYYINSDDSKLGRLYTANIQITNNKIDSVLFKDVLTFESKKHDFFKKFLDLESVIFLNNSLFLSSEGSVYKRCNPTIFEIDTLGNFKSKVKIASRFLLKPKGKQKNNRMYEGLSKSFDGKGFWSAIEEPLGADGNAPSFPTTTSPVRITYYDAVSKVPTKEFFYELSALPRKNIKEVNISGLTDLLEYKEGCFIVIERSYQSGYKGSENIVKLYKACIDKSTSNIIMQDSLKSKYTPMKKELILDFEEIKELLPSGIVDNIEGITFGEKLPNGNQSLILISDDNFQKYNKQINQFVLFELIK